MVIFSKNMEVSAVTQKDTAVLDFLHKLGPNIDNYQALYLFISKMQNQNLRSSQRSTLIETFENIVKKTKGEIFTLDNEDMIIIFGSSAFDEMQACLVKVKFLFHDDPKDILETATTQVKKALENSAYVQVLLPYGVKYVKEYCPKANVVVIPNAVKQFSDTVEYKLKDNYKIIYIARLSKRQKQQHLLIEAFSLIKADYSDWSVELWGPTADEGYDEELGRLIKEKNLEDFIILCGQTNKVDYVMKKADIFAFTSKYEGFGIALAEAMSIGLPSIGVRECLAVNDLIEDKITGLLCENNANDIANKLKLLMSDVELRRRLGQAAHCEMLKYAPENIWNKWESVVKEIIFK